MPPSHKHHFHSAMLVTICVVGGKDDKIVVKYVGAQKRKEIMRSVWVPKFYMTNPLGPKSFWVPKTKA